MAQTRAGRCLDEAWQQWNAHRLLNDEPALFRAASLAHTAGEFARADGNPRIAEWASIALDRFVSEWADQAARALALL